MLRLAGLAAALALLAVVAPGCGEPSYCGSLSDTRQALIELNEVPFEARAAVRLKAKTAPLRKQALNLPGIATPASGDLRNSAAQLDRLAGNLYGGGVVDETIEGIQRRVRLTRAQLASMRDNLARANLAMLRLDAATEGKCG